MTGRTRAGFTLPEALVAGAMFLCISAAFYFTWSGARREEEMASLHLSMLESAAIAMQSLRTDLREMVVLSTAKVDGSSLRVSRSGESLMLRQGALGNTPQSPYLLVQYDLVPAASRSTEPRYHLQRTLRTSDGSTLPGGGASRDVKLFRTFKLASALFAYLNEAAGDDHVVHVSFQVVSEGGRSDAKDLSGEKTMLLTQVLRFLKPPHPRDFAQPLTVAGLETPPQDVLSASLEPLPELPAIQE